MTVLDKDGLIRVIGNIKTYIANELAKLTKANVGLDNVDNTSDADKPISTQQQNALNNKVDKVNGKGLSTNDFTTDEKNKLSFISSGAEVNQNAYSNVSVGTTTLSAGSQTDTLQLVAGSNITLTPDSSANKITISSTGSSGETMTSSDKTKLENTNIAYGTCSTVAETAEKVVQIEGNSDWVLKVGSIIIVKFTITNTASNVTLNVNNTGAKSIWYNNAVYTANSNVVCGYANRYTTYMYDGTNWVWISHGVDNNSDTKNTAGSTDSSSKLFLVGATSQAANPQTYSHNTIYAGTDGCLYSNNKKVTTIQYTTTEPTTNLDVGTIWLA